MMTSQTSLDAAESVEDVTVFYCLACGPVLRQHLGYTHVTWHKKEIPHDRGIDFYNTNDDEGYLQ